MRNESAERVLDYFCSVNIITVLEIDLLLYPAGFDIHLHKHR